MSQDTALNTYVDNPRAKRKTDIAKDAIGILFALFRY
jgi:hypothetical protein